MFRFIIIALFFCTTTLRLASDDESFFPDNFGKPVTAVTQVTQLTQPDELAQLKETLLEKQDEIHNKDLIIKKNDSVKKIYVDTIKKLRAEEAVLKKLLEENSIDQSQCTILQKAREEARLSKLKAEKLNKKFKKSLILIKDGDNLVNQLQEELWYKDEIIKNLSQDNQKKDTRIRQLERKLAQLSVTPIDQEDAEDSFTDASTHSRGYSDFYDEEISSDEGCTLKVQKY